MAADMDASGDFYSVLGLKKECSEAELRNAYKKLALGMVEFLGELAQMMRQTKHSGSGQESFEQLQQMFVEMFHDDLDAGFCGYSSATSGAASSGNKRDNSATDSGKRKPDELGPAAVGFCVGVSRRVHVPAVAAGPKLAEKVLSTCSCTRPCVSLTCPLTSSSSSIKLCTALTQAFLGYLSELILPTLL
ncbi:DnaJ domain [Musa troglodytarum]|uniref:DnaJ domain n=1 Tax=Musa troglodytarum TaxID=320322 RepID=A0A9E7KWP9_9LILI|nr:DnaJ domain [Musa troglodytarum]